MKKSYTLPLIMIISIYAMISHSVYAAGSDGGIKGPPEDYPQIYASFNPNGIFPGSSTLFSWSSINADTCRVTGVPGLSTSSPSGGYRFTAQASLTATITCSNSRQSLTRTARLTVLPPDQKPVITALFNPATVYSGQSSTFTWSAKYANQCYSSGGLSISGTSGSITVTPSSSMTVTVTCTGQGGQASQSATVTVSSSVPPPSFSAYVSPAVIYTRSEWVYVSIYNVSNASYCLVDGVNAGLTGNWVHVFLFDFQSHYTIRVQCYGNGGSSIRYLYVDYFGPRANLSPENMDLSVRLAPGSASNLDIHLEEDDFNNDGIKDRLELNALSRQVRLYIYNPNGGAQLAGEVNGVTALSEVRVTVTRNGQVNLVGDR